MDGAPCQPSVYLVSQALDTVTLLLARFASLAQVFLCSLIQHVRITSLFFHSQYARSANELTVAVTTALDLQGYQRPRLVENNQFLLVKTPARKGQ
jgi:hypothetical protein